jgi:hypothetical protein
MDEQTHGQMKPRGDLYLNLERDGYCSWAVNLLSGSTSGSTRQGAAQDPYHLSIPCVGG